jgi:hypothetical protein
MTVCRTIAEVLAAADADSRDDPPLSQDQADLVAPCSRRTGTCSPARGGYRMARRLSRANPAGSCLGRYHTDRQPGAALQNTAMCPAGPPAGPMPPSRH